MKKVLHLTLIAAATLTLAACQKEIESPVATTKGNEIQLNFSSVKPNLTDVETKTAWTGETITWSKGDAIRIAYTVNDTWQAAAGAPESGKPAKMYASDALTEDAEIASFKVSTYFTDEANQGQSNLVYKFYGIYPSAAGATDFTNAPSLNIAIPAEQTPKANSFDGALDIMYATSADYDGIPSDRNVDLNWHRIVSHADISMRSLQFEAGETLQSITVTAQSGADLVGSHTLNITNGEVTLASGATAGNSVTVKADNLTLSNGAVEFWFTTLPFTASELTFSVKTDKYIYVRSFTGLDLKFQENARNTLSVNMKKAQKFQDYTENFAEGIGEDFTTSGTTGIWNAGSYNGTHYMKASAYINKEHVIAESWLLSPYLTILSDDSALTFEHSIDTHFGTVEDEATIWVRTKGGDWTQLNDVTYPAIPESSYSEFESSTSPLGNYKGQNVQIGFKYIGTEANSGTWEIANFKVTSAEVVYYPSFEITSATTKEVSFNASTVEFTYSAAHLTSNPTIAVKAGSDDIIDGEPTIADGKITVNIKANNDEVAKTATLVVTCEGVTGIPELVIYQAKKENLVEKSVTLDFSAQNYSNQQEVSSLTVAPVTAAFDKGTNSNAPKYYTTGTAVRCYGGNTITLSSAKTIVKAVFTFASEEGTNVITSNVGTYTNGTWTGSSTSVTYTIGGTTGHRRIQKIEVTYMDEAGDEPTPQTPVITLSNVPTENISAEGDVVTINYQIENPVSGVTVSAAPASGGTWVNTFDYDTDGAISFVVDPKTTTGTRTTTITVSYTGAESKTFDITQDGATSGSVTVTKTMAEIASANSWTTSSGTDITCYNVVELDDNVTMSVNEAGNNGSYWVDGWRVYRSASAVVTIEVPSGKSLETVKFTFTAGNNGKLSYGSTQLTSDNAVTVSGTSASFTVGNTNNKTNGQIKITAVEVTYK